MSEKALHAATRFGLGARYGDLAAIQKDPMAWLQQQIKPLPPEPSARFLGSRKAYLESWNAGRDHPVSAPATRLPPQRPIPSRLENPTQVLRGRPLQEGRSPRNPQSLQSPTAPTTSGFSWDAPKIEDQEKQKRDLYRSLTARDGESWAWLETLHTTDMPFAEKWAWFWTQHFAIVLPDTAPQGLNGALRREHLRPECFGSFSEMVEHFLRALVDSIFYVQQQRSPPYALANVILEHYTLGDSGSVQDQQALATAFVDSGTFVFMDTSFSGPNALSRMLEMLCLHPQTARHLAQKLAISFISDTPPRHTIEHLQTVFLQSKGDLAVVAQALIGLKEAWDPLRKVRTPMEYLVASLRLTGIAPQPWAIKALDHFQQPPLHPPSFAGWPDTAQRWITPEALLKRFEWAASFSQTQSGRVQPLQLFETLQPLMISSLETALQEAPSSTEALFLLLGSPEMQRR